MKFLATSILSLILSSTAFAATTHNEVVVCDSVNTSACVQIHFLTDLASNVEGKFEVLILNEPTDVIENFKADLWMQMNPNHGHGSAPLKITSTDPTEYLVTNARFVMKGQWQIRFEFTKNGQTYKLIHLVQISK